MYQNTLDKSSKKFVCPNCGKRSFVRFVENETGKYLAENYGRCDRESECRYYSHPVNEKKHFSTFKIPEVVPTSYINSKLMSQTEIDYNQNNFVSFLLKYFDAKQVGKVLEFYHIGTSKHWEGANIFWQIDNRNRVRTGKIMLYNEVTGKRVKEPYNCISWVHKKLDIDKENIEQCLFGLHRINIDLDKPIAIVEAEKTAIIMSIEAPDFLWLATGSKGNLKEELLKPLKNREIILHPDKGEFKDWQKVVNQLKAKGYKIAISDLLEQMELEQGYDLADYYINEMI
jgi:predicted RNA-binding Zn-ribbon protein involved in translation (DUF1610 family)